MTELKTRYLKLADKYGWKSSNSNQNKLILPVKRLKIDENNEENLNSNQNLSSITKYNIQKNNNIINNDDDDFESDSEELLNFQPFKSNKNDADNNKKVKNSTEKTNNDQTKFKSNTISLITPNITSLKKNSRKIRVIESEEEDDDDNDEDSASQNKVEKQLKFSPTPKKSLQNQNKFNKSIQKASRLSIDSM